MANTAMNDSMSIDIYFDYLCPYVYRASMWLARVKEEMGAKLTINWKYFSLEQVNNDQGPKWKIWEQPEDYPSRGLRAFQAAEAARRQSEAFFESFHFALLKARHEQERDIADMNTLTQVAESAGLEMAKFQKDMKNRRLLKRLAEDHTFAVKLGVFGTPTIVFPGGQALFVKLPRIPPSEESLSFFTEVYHLAIQRHYLQELKRPQPPAAR
ncbi:MAG: DsbA family protein [Dehalococcoidales bacterium]|nr:DsbA family protein [Dehalococcoidales bacterium]